MKRKILLTIFIGLAILVCISLMFYSKDDKLKIYFFNAGKADASIITYKDLVIMIDTSEENLSDEILEYLDKNNIKKIDYLIITHFDKDHVGSASNIIDNIKVDNVFQSNVPKNSTVYSNYIKSLEDKNITPVTLTDTYTFEYQDIKVTINGPNKIYKKNESNNSSLITSIYYKDTNFIFMGDAQKDRLKDFISSNNITYDFVKIPYHGNYQKQLDNLLENIKPGYAVITSSLDYVEDDKMIDLLKEKNIKYYLTRNGEIMIKSDGKKIKIIQ